MINRREFAGIVAAGAASALLPRVSTTQAAQAPAGVSAGGAGGDSAKNVVLVHGLYADASCWLGVIPHLQRAGLNVTAVQNPLQSLEADSAAIRRILALQNGPTVLVGHSFAGTLISETGNDPLVSALVYVAARAPDAGEDFAALAAKYPKPPASAGVVKANGYFWLTEKAFLEDFAGDLDPVRARALYAVQGRGADALVTAKTSTAAWRVKPTWYQVSTNDRTIDPELERFLAKRMKATTIEIAASHLALISHPRQIADLILSATALGRAERPT